MLLSPLFRRFSHRLVQSLDSITKASDLVRDLSDAFLLLRDRSLEVRNITLVTFLLVIRKVQLLSTIFFLVVVVLLLASEDIDHVVDHAHYFPEAHLLALDRQRDEVKLRAALPILPLRLADLAQGARPLAATAGLHLDQARAGARQRLLEELERVVIVEDFDGLSQRNEFLGAYFNVLVVLLLLQSAILLHVCEEGLSSNNAFSVS